MPLKDSLQREFYAELCQTERWSFRTLRTKIGGMLYERTALSRKPAKLARAELAALRDDDRLSTDLVLRDPYILDFLGLKDVYHERDSEAAILREMERFILELDKNGIHVAEYLTVLPPKEVMQTKLQEAVARSRVQLENNSDEL